MSESAGEKTFAPTEKRIREAVGKGDVLRSRDLGTAATMLAGAAWLHFAGAWMLSDLFSAMRVGLRWDRATLAAFEPERMLTGLLLLALPPVLVLGAGVMLAALISQLGVGQGRFLAANALPRGSRLDPAAGLSRMFGAAGWIELGKGLAKVALLGAIAWFWAREHLARLLGQGGGDLAGQLTRSWEALTSLFFALAAGLVIIAMVDFPIQWLRRMRRLRMSQQELRDEHKEAEGSPENKAAQRQRQRQLSMGGVQRAVREAQFLITNPSHFAVAMTYDPAIAPAPVVLAKGRGEKALAMRELAAEFGVPVLEYPPLARSVYFTTRERQVIREELYAAVAGVLAFVLSLKRGESPARPDVFVPVALRFDAEGRLDPSGKA